MMQILLAGACFASIMLPSSPVATGIQVVIITVSVSSIFWLHTLPSFWAHVTPSIIVCKAALSISDRRYPLVIQRPFAIILIVSLLLLLVFEIYFAQLKTLHSIAHINVFLPFALLVFNAGFFTKESSEFCRSIIDNGCLITIGLILLYHEHDPRKIAFVWHQTIGILLIAISGIQLNYSSISYDKSANMSALKHFIVWSYMCLSVHLLLMTLALYMYEEDNQQKGFHDWFYIYPNENESICVYMSYSVLISAVITSCKIHNSSKYIDVNS